MLFYSRQPIANCTIVVYLFMMAFAVAISFVVNTPAHANNRTANTNNAKTYKVYLLIRPTPQGDYLTQLLYAALSASKKADENIEIVFNTTDLSQARWIAELQKGQNNALIWTVTTPERETLLRSIRVPLLRGLYGYRVMVIRPETALLLAQVKTKEQLANFTAGMNSHWPDAKIFNDNHLPFAEGTFATNLYRMLAAGRFDYFPRGVLEITEEQPLIDANKLVLEKQLLIYYPSTLYFFVHNDNQELASRLERGLEILLNNGEFDQLFYQHPDIAAALKSMANRHVIPLNNALFPAGAAQFPPDYFLNH